MTHPDEQEQPPAAANGSIDDDFIDRGTALAASQVGEPVKVTIVTGQSSERTREGKGREGASSERH